MNEATDCRLSGGAKLVLRILHTWRKTSLAKGLKYVWPDQKKLAHEAQCATKTVYRYLRELENARQIFRIRQGQGRPTLTFFVVADARDFLTEARKPIPQNLSDQDRTTVSDQDRTTPLLAFKNSAAAAETARAAAAAVQKALEEYGVPASDLDRADPDHLAEVKAHLDERTANSRKKPITTGYAIGCVRNPARFGFVRTTEGWRRPVERHNLAAVKASRDSAQQRAAFRARYAAAVESPPTDEQMTALRGKAPAPPVAVEKKIDEAAVKVSADQAAWQALGETVRQQIISLVVKEQRLYARTQADFTLLCYAEMRRRGLGPADERERERERERGEA